jgi:hypothetical protein
MATVHCLMTRCRFNDRRLCTLGKVEVGAEAIRRPPAYAEPEGLIYIAPHPVGYASEYQGYLQMAEQQPQDEEPGAICRSYLPR